MSRQPGSLAAQPLVLACILVLVVNDHLLKGASWFPAALAGKLSDFAGLFVFPIVIGSVVELVRRQTMRPAFFATLSVLAAFAFAMIKTVPLAERLAANGAMVLLVPIRAAMGTDLAGPVAFAADRTDLIALVASGLAILYVEFSLGSGSQ